MREVKKCTANNSDSFGEMFFSLTHPLMTTCRTVLCFGSLGIFEKRCKITKYMSKIQITNPTIRSATANDYII